MRIIDEKFFDEPRKKYPKAVSQINTWLQIIKANNWENFQSLNKSFPTADSVTVSSGRQAVVFNICRNDFRLIAGVHYKNHKKEGIVFTLLFLTHAEYMKSNQAWKKRL